MDQATAAMDKVPVPSSPNSSDAVTATPDTTPLLPTPPPADDAVLNDTRADANVLDRFLTRVHVFFSRFCHSLGAFFLRALSTLMLLAGVIGSVIIQMLAYYYTGVLNAWVLVACMLFAPTLAAVAVIRTELYFHGTSRSGAAPPMSQYVTLAYLVITVCGVASLLQPLVLHGESKIAVKSLWTAVGGVVFFYYSMLVSEVLYAVALNVDRAKERDEERRRREREDPFWLASYNATRQASE